MLATLAERELRMLIVGFPALLIALFVLVGLWRDAGREAAEAEAAAGRRLRLPEPAPPLRTCAREHRHAPPDAPRLAATLREKESVTPLELFFDLVFVLALTQCTALMAKEPTWEGLAKAMLILAVLWWSWGGYAWLTSLVDPEEGIVRIAMFGAMAAFLVAALCVPEAFDETGAAVRGRLRGRARGAHRAVRDRQPRRRRTCARR